MKRTIGILGGMGPEATAYFFNAIITNTRARSDQEHLPMLIWNDPQIPPRTDAILDQGPSPLPYLLKGAKILEAGGADFIVMPCITAHFWASEIAAQSNIPFVSLFEETTKYAFRILPGLQTAGLIASTGTVRSRLWHKVFEKERVKILTPEPDEQKEVMSAIFGKKGIKGGFTAGPPRTAIAEIARRLVRRGADAIIAGCTEVPLVLRDGDLPVPLIEPMHATALTCIRKAGGKPRPKQAAR